MDIRKGIDLPLQGEYEDALAMAWEDLSSSNLTRVASNAAARHDREGRRLQVQFLDENVSVEIGEKRVLDESGQALRVYQSIIVLHYLLGAKPFGPSGNWLTFREFDSGRFYYSAYEKRSLAPLIEVFGSDPELLVKASAVLGGEVIDIGDAGVRFGVFPKLPLAVAVWQGDEELSASANILFDGSAGSILTTEDLVVVAGFVTGKLVKQARQLSSG